MTDPADLAYLDSLYAASEDPWHARSGWYGERKQELLLASLPRARYLSCFEPGCGTGELTVQLARRCDQLLAVDYHRDAVDSARERVRHLSNVAVRRMLLPQEWPYEDKFDLVVLSEFGYYCSGSAWAEICSRVLYSLATDATVLACHWRHDFAERTLETDTVHGMLDSVLRLPKHTAVIDADLMLEVWTTGDRSVAELEGLTASGRPH
jgi:SAM-dependent methyltransferase